MAQIKTKTKKIKKILIANRGEIACRVMRTATRLGIKTVAVYSDADENALHTRSADEAVYIGASPAAESYLVIDKIIKAAKTSGADAVHPGYGFLSENPKFVRACEKAGLNFIGPSAASMEAMGLKDAAKKLMEKAGVPVTPGYHGYDQNPKLLEEKAGEIGYPVLIKAVAGGGGKGMRKVEMAADFGDALASCRREAKSSFGNDDVLIEKYITSPRHIEVQIFGDTNGHVVHMFERDCSLQRRHQKVIEEAPAPGMTKTVRAAMTKAAIDAAKAVDYVGAGTVEFIVDGSGKLTTDGFWFMEMNTRLQVEHPVSEKITGYDFVELQIRIAEGGKLPKQKDITLNGHAVEARLYAEDPANDFLPSVGRIERMDFPAAVELNFGVAEANRSNISPSLRMDTGVFVGARVSPFYDPMIGKLIAWAHTRSEAVAALANACANLAIYPLKTNTFFVEYCLENRYFKTGKISTDFIPALMEKGIPYPTAQSDLNALSQALSPIATDTLFGSTDGWRLNQARRDIQYRWINGEAQALPLSSQTIAKRKALPPNLVRVGSRIYDLAAPAGLAGGSSNTNAMLAPMPGKIIAINVKVGDPVKAGDKVMVMEAMKMEMSLEAPRDGVIANLPYGAGDLVSDGEILLELEE